MILTKNFLIKYEIIEFWSKETNFWQVLVSSCERRLMKNTEKIMESLTERTNGPYKKKGTVKIKQEQEVQLPKGHRFGRFY